MPLARVEAGAALPLSGRGNPAWSGALAAFQNVAVAPLYRPTLVVRAAASVVIAGVALAAKARQAAADMVSFSVSGSGSDGSLGASLTFKTINGVSVIRLR